MSTELAVPTQLVDIRTGELVEATPANAAELLGVVREYIEKIHVLRRECEAVLIEESQLQGTKTLHLGTRTATISTGHTLAWDTDVLTRLLRLGLPTARYDELVVATVTYKVSAAIAKQLAGANEEYAKVIEEARSEVEAPLRVSIT